MGRIGWLEIVLIVVAIVLLFGAKKIPELMRGLGSGIKEFKNGMREDGTPAEKDSKNGSGKDNTPIN